MNQHIKSLTGFRALAAGMVLITHLVENQTNCFWIAKYGWTGVNFFFVLSGFLFVLLYYNEFSDGIKTVRNYFLKRLFRIYPLYLFLLAIEIFTRGKPIDFKDVFCHLTMIHSYFKEYRYSINSPVWTLSVEETFYAIVPILFLFLGLATVYWREKVQQKFLMQILLLLFVYFTFNNLFYFVVDFRWDILHVVDTDSNGLYTATLIGRFSDFAFGIATGLFVLYFPNHPFIQKKTLSSLFFLTGIALFCGIAGWIEENGGPVQAGVVNGFLFSLLGKGFGLSAALMIFSLYGNSLFKGFFAHPVVVYLGKISFALYLVQFVSFFHVERLAEYAMEIANSVIPTQIFAVIAVYLGMNVVAALLYHSIESPIQKYLRRKFL